MGSWWYLRGLGTRSANARSDEKAAVSFGSLAGQRARV